MLNLEYESSTVYSTALVTGLVTVLATMLSTVQSTAMSPVLSSVYRPVLPCKMLATFLFNVAMVTVTRSVCHFHVWCSVYHDV